jgi:hypothetical protein
MVCEWFGLKTTRTVFAGLTSKLVATVSPSLTLKSVLGFLVEAQNQGGGGFPNLGLKTGSSGLMICPQNHHDSFLFWTSKPNRLRFVGCATKLTEGGQRGTRVEI